MSKCPKTSQNVPKRPKTSQNVQTVDGGIAENRNDTKAKMSPSFKSQERKKCHQIWNVTKTNDFLSTFSGHSEFGTDCLGLVSPAFFGIVVRESGSYWSNMGWNLGPSIRRVFYNLIQHILVQINSFKFCLVHSSLVASSSVLFSSINSPSVQFSLARLMPVQSRQVVKSCKVV